MPRSGDTIGIGLRSTTIHQQLGSSIFGSPGTVKDKLQSFLDDTQADELMVIAQVFDHKARLHSYEVVTTLFKS